jgi:hypothetical protein
MWMLPVIFRTLRLAVVCDRLQKIVLEEPERTVIRFAEPLTGLDDLIENRLDPRAPRDSAKHTADCALLLTEILQLTSLVLGVL